jgi:hypothetical protein
MFITNQEVDATEEKEEGIDDGEIDGTDEDIETEE